MLVSGPSNASAFTLNPDGSFSYAPASGFSGDDAFSYKANDGGLDSNTVTVSLTVSAVNDAPSVSAPATAQVAEDQTFTFTGPASITIYDPDAGGGTLKVTLGVTSGTLTLGGTMGLSFTTGDGTSNTAMIFSGTLTSVNSALQGLAYRPDADYSGSDMLSLLVDDNGNTGSGGARTGSATVEITIRRRQRRTHGHRCVGHDQRGYAHEDLAGRRGYRDLRVDVHRRRRASQRHAWSPDRWRLRCWSAQQRQRQRDLHASWQL